MLAAIADTVLDRSLQYTFSRVRGHQYYYLPWALVCLTMALSRHREFTKYANKFEHMKLSGSNTILDSDIQILS